MNMDPWLADLYKTASPTAAHAPTDEDIQKVAQTDLFLKLAAENGIDLTKMSEAQIDALWTATFTEPKTASDESPEEKAKKEKERANEEKKASDAALQQKMVEADYMGKVAAHAFTAELRAIASETEKQAENGPGASTPSFAERAQGGHSNNGAATAAEGAAKQHQTRTTRAANFLQKHVTAPAFKHPVRAAAAVGGAAVAAGGAAALHHHFKKKNEKPAEGTDKQAMIDDLNDRAADMAMKIAEAGGYDTEQAAIRIAGVLEMDLAQDYAKTASATTEEAAIANRGLEILAAAGYPVDWK